MSKMKLKNSLEKIEHVINEACKTLERLNLSNISNCSWTQPIAAKSSTTADSPMKVIGRDKDCDKITPMLHEKNGCGLCYSVVGIHGISGSGKSTLAQLVCAHEKTNDYFDIIMWVHVSQRFSVAAIYREMVEVASDYSGAIYTNLDGLQNVLASAIRNKRFLLVLDDVWCNKDPRNQNLPQLLSPLKYGKRGSKILVTSRNADAVSDLGPDVKSTLIPIHDLNDSDYLKLFMYYALGDKTVDDQDGSMLWNIGAHIAEKLKRSPLAARIVGGQLCKSKNVEYWRKAKDHDLLNGTMGALSWSYQHLDDEVRRCFAYCSVFPGRRPLRRDELVRMWVAEGLIRNNNAGKELEDVGEEYFDELVSSSFLQLGVKGYHYQNYYVMHDLLHHLAERVTGNDCFRIESGWTGEVPRGVRHLFVDNLNGEMLMKRSVELENLQTLIINSIGVDTPPLDEKVLESMFRRLPKLRVLFIGFIRQAKLSVPTTIGLLKHLRLLAFRVGPSCRLILPSTFSKLYQIQTVDFGECHHLSFPSGEEIVNLVSLRYARTIVDIGLVNISRSTSLHTVPSFALDQKHKLKRLRDLSKISGSLDISNLYRFESMEEALEAKLSDKERLTELSLSWGSDDHKSSNPEVQAEVLEGLCPPMSLESLTIYSYDGVRYPNWMLDKQSSGPKYLQELRLFGCSRLGPAPELFEVFNNLRSFSLRGCSWEALPSSIEYLRFLKELKMYRCLNIRSLRALPQTLERFELDHCDEEFMRSCETIGDANWEKIQHIASREFSPSNSSSRSKGVSFDDNVSILGA